MYDVESPMLPMVALLSPPTDEKGHIQSEVIPGQQMPYFYGGYWSDMFGCL